MFFASEDDVTLLRDGLSPGFTGKSGGLSGRLFTFTACMLEKNLAIIREITGTEPQEDADELQLLHLLTLGISKLLEESGGRLFQVLYRLDVSEKKVQAVLKKFPASRWPEEIASLVMEREKERQFWRQRYQRDTASDPANDDQQE